MKNKASLVSGTKNLTVQIRRTFNGIKLMQMWKGWRGVGWSPPCADHRGRDILWSLHRNGVAAGWTRGAPKEQSSCVLSLGGSSLK